MDPARANALAAMLDDRRRFAPGDALPPFFHQIYFWEATTPDALAEDGHARLGTGLIPDLGLPRRMWAGGKLAFHAPLLAGEVATKTSVVESRAEKAGRSGRLGFVTLRHEIAQAGTVKVTEWQEVVYLEERAPDAPPPRVTQAPEDASAEARRFSEVDLFRYSALTYNAHRIHYDPGFATGQEGYPGLLVHGPLLAQELLLKAARDLGPLAGFRYRATAPAIVNDEIALCRDGTALWVRGADGQLCMDATATPA
ncbi:acyl-CoA dehydrogenase [Sinisalibacter aestuarii]|uniref:Acyl-CoA dehydrogenase n=2 Tax=Sinisalibacter aestuarii TaxID=2949426 RepID=A0ABQ5LV36_9RHOB|nr:acyl-CoA dehydrogenase [Sinisalibacter aestuarii]